MYAAGTILALKEQRPNDEETDEPFAYNQVEVIGSSPIAHTKKGDWTGGDAKGVIIRPLANFGSTLDEPYGKLRSLYDVETIPEPVVLDSQVRVRVINPGDAGPTPEQVFAEKAPGKEREPREKTSPLVDPGPPEKDGPLGKGDVPEPVDAPPTDTSPL